MSSSGATTQGSLLFHVHFRIRLSRAMKSPVGMFHWNSIKIYHLYCVFLFKNMFSFSSNLNFINFYIKTYISFVIFPLVFYIFIATLSAIFIVKISFFNFELLLQRDKIHFCILVWCQAKLLTLHNENSLCVFYL